MLQKQSKQVIIVHDTNSHIPCGLHDAQLPFTGSGIGKMFSVQYIMKQKGY